jgi:transmembrane sensor
MKYNKEVIERFFSGKMSRKDALEFLDWLHSDEGRSAYNEMTQEAWEEIGTGGKPKEVNPTYQVTSRSVLAEGKMMNSSRYRRKEMPRWTKYSLPAVVFVIVFASASFFTWKSQSPQVESAVLVEVKTQFKTTPKGRKSKVVLPDGSVVHMNSESQIAYPENFKENRTITLTGEAFFEVAEDPLHPFEVTSGSITTVALGTSFNIKAYPNSEAIQVSLATGKVHIRELQSQREVVMDPGHAVNYYGSGADLLVEPVKIANVLLWKEGVLSFEKTAFSDVIETIERWYGVEVAIFGTETIPHDKCSGTFEPNEYLSNVLNALGYSMNFTYTINGKKVTITFNSNRL